MRTLSESDIYSKYMDKDNGITNKIFKTLKDTNSSTILNDKLDTALEIMRKTYKDPTTIQIINSIKNGEIILYVTEPELNMPTCIPFFKYVASGKTKVSVNLTNHIQQKKDKGTGEVDYIIDNRKFYILCLSAFITLKLLDKRTVLPATVISDCAYMWAKMYTKVLNKMVGLSTNKERYESFMYFAIRFFCKYFLECPDALCDTIAESYLPAGKTMLIHDIERKVSEKGINMYSSVETFCNTLFNNSITNLKATRLGDNVDMNSYLYFRKFVDMYDFSAAGSLCSFPYFLFTIISVFYSGNMVSRSLDDIVITDDAKQMPRILNGLKKEIR